MRIYWNQTRDIKNINLCLICVLGKSLIKKAAPAFRRQAILVVSSSKHFVFKYFKNLSIGHYKPYVISFFCKSTNTAFFNRTPVCCKWMNWCAIDDRIQLYLNRNGDQNLSQMKPKI